MKLNVLHRFTLLSMVTTLIVAVALAFLVSAILTEELLSREAQVTADAIRSITRVDLAPDLFARAVRDGDTAKFAYIWQHVRQMREVFRIKIYDATGRIVWSEAPHLIGKVYQHNDELQEALRGEVAAELGKVADKPEYKDEGLAFPSEEILELYVPLTIVGDNTVYGVVEAYKHPAAYLADKHRWLLIVWGGTLGGGVVVFFSLFWVFRRTVHEQEHLHKTEREFLRVSAEMKWAAEIQKRLLPEKLPDVPRVAIAALNRPAGEIGGDFYDVFRAHDGSIAFVIGDNEGSGIGAALLMAQTQSMLHAHIEVLPGAARVMRGVNDTLTMRGRIAGFVTVCFARLNPATLRLTYCNAGHPPPLRVRRQTACALEKGGMPLGVQGNTDYEEGEEQLEPGDVVLFYTDGVTEATGPDGLHYGQERLAEALVSIASLGDPDRIIQEIVSLVTAFREESQHADDMALICLVVSREAD